MIRFFVYSNLKNYLQGGDPSKDIGSVRTFIIGGIAGAASVFGNTPVDVVKTRMQVCCGSEGTAKYAKTYYPKRSEYYNKFSVAFCSEKENVFVKK